VHELPTAYQQSIHATKYSRWRDDLGRRELWPETVDRYLQFWESRLPELLAPHETEFLRSSLVNTDAVPSMRCLMTAGPALEKDEVAGYNCSYVTVSRPEAWDEMMYMLMCGTGVGYSVEARYTSKLPAVPPVGKFREAATDEVIVVADSKYGWAESFRRLIKQLYVGVIPKWDTSKVRQSGAVLKTFGGRASGPAPLEALFRHCVTIFTEAAGRQLTPRECHSISTKIGDIVVVGGVRRSAMISLFDAGDRDMFNAKMGDWSSVDPHFGMANNSAVYEQKPSVPQFMKAMATLVKGQSGEPGIFSRAAAREQATRFGRDGNHEFGVNPCGEIILRDRQLCNLSEAIARPDDDYVTLARKVEVATIFGTLQSSLTNFRHLSPQWKRNCEDERLLGVSIAGVPDHKVLNGRSGKKQLHEWQERLRDLTWEVNAKWAERIGINPTKSPTCLKPSGNTSQLVNASSPLKPQHDKYFVRRTRGNKTDPVSRFLRDRGVVCEDEAWHPETTWVFSWPMKAPAGALTRHDLSAIEQLELWHDWREHYTTHNPSVTVNVKRDEWLDVSAWLWRHWDNLTGIALLPDEDHTYVQAPYESCTRQKYEALLKQTPQSFDWTQLTQYETNDRTESARELACAAGVCEIP
jgi:ribonucleoside-triphosphate reductase